MRPHAATAILGCVLSLASTALALVPPYLTMPLVDDVLIPRQNGTPVPFAHVAAYLAALAAAAVAAWLLAWARSWTLAWVSERIASDLRMRTYDHMQSLSLDFYASRRTGDLISRVGNDTDRINNFLSLHFIDFSSDVLLVAFTAAILLWINPVLALVTLVPFPFVIWLVYAVRARMRRGFTQASVAWGDMTSLLADTIPGIRVVKAFAQERRESRRFAAADAAVIRANDLENVDWSHFGPLDGLPRLFPGHDPAGDEAGNLADQHRSAGRPEKPGLVLVAEIDFQVAGIEKLSGGVVGFLHDGVTGAAVDVDVEHGEEDSHAAEFAEAETGILSLVDADDLAVRRADEGKGIGGRVAVGIAKEKKQPGQEQGGHGRGDPPTEPETGAQEHSGTDQEGSCFGQSHRGFLGERRCC